MDEAKELLCEDEEIEALVGRPTGDDGGGDGGDSPGRQLRGAKHFSRRGSRGRHAAPPRIVLVSGGVRVAEPRDRGPT